MENKEKAAASRLIKKYSIILILIALMIVLTMIKPQFIKPGNLVNMLRQISLVGILTMGMMLVILIGDIDISGGPQIALTSVICAYFASRECPLVLAFLMPLLAGIVLRSGQWCPDRENEDSFFHRYPWHDERGKGPGFDCLKGPAYQRHTA